MIKLTEIFQEGALQLTSDERNQVEAMLPDIIKVISGKYIGDNMKKQVGDINAVSADKTPIKVGIYVGNNLYNKNADAYYQTNDKNNPDDNEILIQQFHFSPYFKGLAGLDMKLTKIATGNENTGIERLRKVLKHELIHAKDPAVNQRYMNEPYSYNPEIYYKSWTEFQTMTGQFFEAITTGVDRAFELGMSKDEVLKALNNILEYYSGKTKTFNQEAKDFIQGSGKRNIFQSLINFFTKLPSSIDDYAAYIASIKKYNPEGYKEFLGDLYKTVDQARDKVKNLKEMKYINEAKRFQKLAGILTEAEQVAVIADKIEDKLESFEDKLQAFAKNVKPSPKDKKLNEIDPVTTIATVIAGAPGLLSFLGKGVDWIASAVTGGDVDKTIIGQALQKAGHKLEHAYIDGIAQILVGFYPEAYANQNQHDETTALHDHCHAIYAAIVGAAAIVSGMGAAHATGVVKALEVGATGLKTSEVIALAQKIAAA